MKEERKPEKNERGEPNRRPEEETIEADVVNPEYKLFWPTNALVRMFSSLFHRNYALLWTGAFLSNIGTWMQMVALSWVVFSLTKSARALGIVNFLNSLPVFFFVLYAGSLADRINRRRLLVIAETLLLLFALALGILSSLSKLNMYWIASLTFLTGMGTAFIFPTWQAIIPDVVPRRDLMNAIALNSAQFNGARMIGPAMAGVVLAAFGAAANFYVNAVSFLAVIIALFMIQPSAPKPRPVKSAWRHLLEGLRYARRHPTVGLLLMYVGILTVFGLSYVVLLPIYASDVLKTGAKGYGFLAGASGLGSLTGALTVASVAHMKRRGGLVKWTIGSFGIFLILFSLSKAYFLSLALMVGVGWSFLASTSTINTMIQEAVPNEIRGRVMAIYIWMFLGLQPFGSLGFGELAHRFQPQTPILIGGGVLLLSSILLFAKPHLLDHR